MTILGMPVAGVGRMRLVRGRTGMVVLYSHLNNALCSYISSANSTIPQISYLNGGSECERSLPAHINAVVNMSGFCDSLRQFVSSETTAERLPFRGRLKQLLNRTVVENTDSC